MDVKELKIRATELRERTSGMLGLFLLPIAVGLAGLVFDWLAVRLFGRASISFFSQMTWLSDHMHTNYDFSFRPSVLVTLLAELLLVTACFQLVQVVRQKRREVSYQESWKTLFGQHSGPILATILIKEIFLFLCRLPKNIGLVWLAFASFFYLPLGIANSDPEMVSIWLQDMQVILALSLVMVGFIFEVIQGYAYSQVSYILYDHLEAGRYSSPFAILKESRLMMKGHKWDRFYLDFSFIGWHIGIALTFGLLAFYVYPYYFTTTALFYEQLKKESTKA